ncbi:hypothetical protein [Nioella sp.]|uniref:hypothetical protein n=1 Tax=Nioella sp. TaxID=1912091 RepID=UPI003511A771
MTTRKTSGRRPANAGTPIRQDIWNAIRRKDAPFTVTEVSAETGAARKTIHDYLGCLAAGGYVLHTPAGTRGQPAEYTMLRDTGHHAPRLRRDGSEVQQGRATEQLWRSMIILKRFTFRDLIQTATINIPEATASAYCRDLLAAGYLRVLRKAEPKKGGIAEYVLIRHSGPRSPQVQRIKQVYDPNTGEVFAAENKA